MRIILPVKHLHDSKIRLKEVLSDEQRSRFSYLLVMDTLQILCSAKNVQGVTMISSDQSLSNLAEQYKTEFILTDKDSGYSNDAMLAISALTKKDENKVAIIPTDLPQLSYRDLELLDDSHKDGITLCAAEKDGGTNALIFTLPLAIPLLFGPDSFNKHQQAAKDRGIIVNIVQTQGMQRDIDQPNDLLWLSEQSTGGEAWKYAKELMENIIEKA